MMDVQSQNCLAPSSPIGLWRADPKVFNITDAHIYPIFTETGLPIFGDLYVTWVAKVGENVLPAIVRYQQNHITSFQIFEYSRDAHWFVTATEVLLIQNYDTSSKLTWMSTQHPGKVLELNHTLPNVSARFRIAISESTKSTWEINFRLNSSSLPQSGTWGFFSDLIFDSTDLVLLDNWLFTGLYRNITSNELLVRDPSNEYMIPHQINNPSLFSLGYNLVDVYSPKMAIIGNNEIFSLENSSLIQVPGKMENFYNYGLSSSLLLTSGGFFEFSADGWNKIENISGDPVDILAFDIGLYFGIVLDDGVAFQFFGEDDDGDGLPSIAEAYYSTNPFDPDSDHDGFNDYLEVAFGTLPNTPDGEMDYDEDGLPNSVEYHLGLHPLYNDTDFGGASDGVEIKYDFDACNSEDDGLDPDSDGLSNSVESTIGSSPVNKDTDSDGISDSNEYFNNLNPLDPADAYLDYDNDGRSNLEEFKLGTDPFSKDAPPPFRGLEIWILVIGSPIVIMTVFIYRRYLQGFMKKNFLR